MFTTQAIKLALLLFLFVILPVMLMRYMVSKTIEIRQRDKERY